MATRAPTTTRRRLGEILVDLGLVDEPTLQQALQTGRETGRMLGDVLLEEGLISGDDLLRALAAQYGVEFVDLSDVPIDAELVRRVPAHVARGHRAVPYAYDGDTVLVAMANPIDVVAVDDIRHLLQAPVKAVMADGAQIDATIEPRRRQMTGRSNPASPGFGASSGSTASRSGA